jgi:hypothetical protein
VLCGGDSLSVFRVVFLCCFAFSVCGAGFYGRIDKSGRITVPKLTLKLMGKNTKPTKSLTGTTMEIKL